MDAVYSVLQHPAITQFNHLSIGSKVLLGGTVAITSERIVAFIKHYGLSTVSASLMTTGFATSILLYLGSEAFDLSRHAPVYEHSKNHPKFTHMPGDQSFSGMQGYLNTFNHLSIIGKIVLCGTVAITSERIVAFIKHYCADVPTFAAFTMAASLSYMALSVLKGWAEGNLIRKLLVKKNALLCAGLLPAEQKKIKFCIEYELSVKRPLYQEWEKGEKSQQQLLPWCSDPTVQKVNPTCPGEWMLTTTIAQAHHEILPGLTLGGNYAPKDIYDLHGQPLTIERQKYELVVQATCDFTEYSWQLKDSTTYHQFANAHDSTDVGVGSFSENDCAAFKTEIAAIDEALKLDKKVLVMCRQGIDRSVTVVIGYLMSIYKLSYEDALIFVRSRRYIAEPTQGFQDFLKNTWQQIVVKSS